MLASLDVESLFTNVPVEQTIDIILNNVYHHSTLPPPDIPPSVLKELLLICTTKTPFSNVDGELYVQCEGVSMGSALGPTFAEFYMCHLENSVFDKYPELKPFIYVRYVDDCFLQVANEQNLLSIKSKFEQESVLKFTIEYEKNKQLAYLDTLVNRTPLYFKTSVYIKTTNFGDCLNYSSICPDKYKSSVINTLLHRAYQICSDWETFHVELIRIKQLLTNNNFPMKIIDERIRKFLDNVFVGPNPETNLDAIKFYFRNQMSQNYKNEEKILNKIIDTHIKPVKDNKKVSLFIYYKNKKLQNLFIKNKVNSNEISVQHHVVYSFKCTQEGCNSLQNYIGYTTCTVGERFKMHAQIGSIKKHLNEKHNIQVRKNDMVKNVEILGKSNNVSYLRMLEAVLIKDLKPNLNSQEEGCDKLLKVFKH